MPGLPWRAEELALWSEFCKKASTSERDIQVLATLYPENLNLVAEIFDCSLERVHWVLASAMQVLGAIEESKRYLESLRLEFVKKEDANRGSELLTQPSDPLFEMKWVAQVWSKLLLPKEEFEVWVKTLGTERARDFEFSTQMKESLQVAFICWGMLDFRWREGLLRRSRDFLVSLGDYDRPPEPLSKSQRNVFLGWEGWLPQRKAFAFSLTLLVLGIGGFLTFWSKPHLVEPYFGNTWESLSFLPRSSVRWASWWEGLSGEIFPGFDLFSQRDIRHSVIQLDQPKDVTGVVSTQASAPAVREAVSDSYATTSPQAATSRRAVSQATENDHKISLNQTDNFRESSSLSIKSGDTTSKTLVQSNREPNLVTNKEAQKPAGSYVWRAYLRVAGNSFDPQAFLAQLNHFQPIKAGQVDLGWKKKPHIYYYHFLTKEKWDQELATFLKGFGSLQYERAPHPRVIEPEQSRWILEIYVPDPSGLAGSDT